ncbi:MAG: bile acid-coenzyme ligase, partial [Actinomycetota bacterium]|nr:bile acid-coenzyme ligase [Actinomycetota bacterium]
MVVVSFAQRLTDLAHAAPGRIALTCGAEQVTRADFDSRANRLGRDLASRGVGVGDMVTIALPNSVAWFVAAAAAWKIGAVPQPVSARLPDRELAAIVELADPKVVFGVEPDKFAGRTCLPLGYVSPADIDDSPLPDAVSPAWKAPTSG